MMSPHRHLAAPGTSPAVVRAGEADLDVLSQVIADAFHDLAPSRWLIPDPEARRQLFPGYFRLYLEHALASGAVHTTAGRTAAALWVPSGQDAPDGYDLRLAAVTSPWTSRFVAFDATLDRHHPAGVPHCHLAILAVHPDQQGQGIGTALLHVGHAKLDGEGTPAYLKASGPRSRDLYLAHGYTDHGSPIQLSEGVLMHPMWREPHVRTGRNDLVLDEARRERGVSSAGLPAEASGDSQSLTVLGDALDRLGLASARRLAEAAVLIRAFPRWAVWLPEGSGTWTAARPAGLMPPGPEAPMVWVRAGTAGQLASLMRAADTQLPTDGRTGL
jgi:GNAT superfamily N-acetyltransferase